VLEDYFLFRARSIDLLIADNPAFRRLYRTPGDHPVAYQRLQPQPGNAQTGASSSSTWRRG
jgi:hypothetical protein